MEGVLIQIRRQHQQCDQIGRCIGYFLMLLETINLPKSPTFLANFYKGVKINHFSSEIIFGQLL